MVLHILKKQKGILQAQNMLHMPQNYKGLLVGASASCLRSDANCGNKVLVTSGLVRTEGKNVWNRLKPTQMYRFKKPATPIKLHITKTEEETEETSGFV